MNKRIFLTDVQELTGRSVMRSPFGDEDFSDNAAELK